jgi:long-subunit acyl-CoA synthetase (AMP-forming)
MSKLLTAHRALLGWSGNMPEREFLLQPINGQLQTLTFRQAADQACRMANALVELGMRPGDKVAILGKNSAEWVLADLSIAMAGLISVPIYPTANADTVAYVLDHSEAKAVFVGKLDESDAICQAIPQTLPTIAFPYPGINGRYAWQDLIDRQEPIDNPHDPDEEDVMTILYTSGSTGQPKGVAISFRAYAYACGAARKTVRFGKGDRLLSYLPLAHVTERMVLVGPAIYSGSRIFFVESLKTFNKDLQTAQPTIFGSVPRLWVKFQAGIHAKIPPRKLRLLLAIPVVNRIVARRIRDGMGLGRCRTFASGTAPISPHTLHWYRKLGIDIGEGWGMSETSGLACANIPFRARRTGTIGLPLEQTELKVSEEGELLIRSPGLFSEYYRQPELTAESFSEDGFFKTGDKAEWDERHKGYRITGRVKDIFKSAKGKYVVPVPIESRLSANPLLDQICVTGPGLPAPVALAVISEAAKDMPREAVSDSLKATLSEVNGQLESHERLSNIIVVRDEWTTENGLLTPTLKVKRDELEQRYHATLSRPLTTPVVWEADL